MKQIDSEKYSLAWFKLAECVARREKERALGVLRLLVHSLEDNALAYQLKGDVFLSFDETDDAIEFYKQAAEEYYKKEHILEAAGIYEHLVFLVPNSKEYVSAVVRLYKRLGMKDKVANGLLSLYNIWIQEKSWSKAYDALLEFMEIDFSSKSLALVQKFVINAVTHKYFDEQKNRKIISLHLDYLVKDKLSSHTTQFLASLKAVDNSLNEFACEYIGDCSK